MMSFDPLRKVHDAGKAGLLPPKVYQTIVDRFHLVTEGVARVEKASGIKYPYYYIEPSLVVSTSQAEFTQLGIFFARTIPAIGEDSMLHVVVQITAPLVAYSLKGTLHAILAHEFMHYLELVGRVTKMNIISDEISGTLFEGTYADGGRLVEARAVFRSDPTLVRHITTRFPEGFRDMRLEDKAIKEWMDKGLPTTSVPIDANVIKIPFEAMAKLKVDPEISEKIAKFENAKVRRRTNEKKESSDADAADNSIISGGNNTSMSGDVQQ
jgi:hypothetical protein